ncbi:MAG TPA: hypothetical protein VG253_26425 [Streptosporangiaceae bacterium]|jgi:hypothetical protein|nr:hypothetical protein [Streptosporangiaceae bacterium]
MSTEVSQLLAALRDGTMSLDEVADRFRQRSWPRRPNTSPTTYLELAAAAEQDPEPDVPGSFDEVDAAYDQGKISDDEYDALARAMSDSLRAEDSGE